MATVLNFISLLIYSIGVFILICFLIISVFEKEKMPVKRIIPILVFMLVVLTLSILGVIPMVVQMVTITLSLFVAVVIIIPFGNKSISFTVSKNQFDERDIMFSRMELEKGTDKFEDYYKSRPANASKDELFRKEPGLLSSQSKYYNPMLFNAAAATFSAVDLLQPLVETNEKSENKTGFNSIEISSFLKKWTLKLGAVDVGFTLIKPHHLYSHIGRGKDYGQEITLDHKYAIAFTVEMNHESLSYTPQGPIIMESAQQYLNAGTIAVQVAEFIRNLGFDARAHIDANYRLICPIVAQDAGLGTIGRMGLLMTPKLGPRVRIGVITTNLELECNDKTIDSTVIQFCEICKKCSSNCPSLAISKNSGQLNGNWLPWRIDHEKCFTYWCKAGTDCGRCVTVCPYSHPNNFIHNVVRLMIKRNSLNRWLALQLDDFFYGRKLKVLPFKNWLGLKSD